MTLKKSINFENTLFELSMRLNLNCSETQIEYYESSSDYQIVKNDVKQIAKNIYILPCSNISSVHIFHDGKIYKYINIGDFVYCSKNNLLKFESGSLASFKSAISKFIKSNNLSN